MCPQNHTPKLDICGTPTLHLSEGSPGTLALRNTPRPQQNEAKSQKGAMVHPLGFRVLSAKPSRLVLDHLGISCIHLQNHAAMIDCSQPPEKTHSNQPTESCWFQAVQCPPAVQVKTLGIQDILYAVCSIVAKQCLNNISVRTLRTPSTQEP
jgi:hypothetical protein